MGITMVLINFVQTYSVENLFNSEWLSAISFQILLVKRDFNQGSPFAVHKPASDIMSYYLAGLLEGDGHFNTPKKLTTPSGKARVAAIEVVFALKDKPSAELLQSLFGGKIYDHSLKKITRWLIQDKKSVTKVINLINGKLRTPKINYLYEMIDFLNAKGDNIIKLPLDTSPLNSNAWFAGFIDADGHFAIKGFTSNPKSYLAFQFYLVQRKTDKSGESLEKSMFKITEFLQVKLNERAFNEKFHQFVICTSNPVSNKILIDYLNNYPLLSSKYLDFKDWETANNKYINKLHKDPVEFENIRNLKANMNKNRTYFSWAHHELISSR